jgi:hypothetical protein
MASATTVRKPPFSNAYMAEAVVPPGEVTYSLDRQTDRQTDRGERVRTTAAWMISAYIMPQLGQLLVFFKSLLCKDCAALDCLQHQLLSHGSRKANVAGGVNHCLHSDKYVLQSKGT